MSENSLRSVLERALDMKRNGAGNEFWDEWEQQADAALAATQEPQPQPQELEGLRERISNELAEPYSESVFTPLSDDELRRCVDALANSGVRAASDRLHASWARHWAKWLMRGQAGSEAAAPRPELAPALTTQDVHAAIKETQEPWSKDKPAYYAVTNVPTLTRSLNAVLAEREAPRDLAGALERLAEEWCKAGVEIMRDKKQGLNARCAAAASFQTCADKVAKLAAQLKVQR